MEVRIQRIFLALLASLGAAASNAQSNEGTSLDRIITPDIERREIREAVLDQENFEIGVFAGVLNVEDFGSNSVTGLRLSYHVTEDFFLEATYAQSELGETSFERLSGSAPLLTDEQRELSYYNLSIGYNILPGEVFLGEGWAFNSAFYLLLGAGNTSFADEEHFTWHLGGGLRFYLTDWLALHGDVRDHVFSHDLLGEDLNTHNLETSLGFTVFF